ncbi:MAG: DsbC family protein [Gammaproteobacteria bacterium]
MQTYRTLVTLSLLPLAFVAVGAGADELTKEQLAGQLSGIEAKDISNSPLTGIYQVAIGSNVAYVTSDGRYIIRGDIYDAKSSMNLTEETRSKARVAMLKSVDPASMIVFKPAAGKPVKHTVTIFTDVDCGYCRQFHREIDKVTALGIEVHYLFYPRTGPNTESWAKAEGVWCSPDHNAALTRAKLGEVPTAKCAKTPVEAHYTLGQRIGVRGTPAVFTETGELIGGYLPPAALAKILDDPTAAIDE